MTRLQSLHPAVSKFQDLALAKRRCSGLSPTISGVGERGSEVGKLRESVRQRAFARDFAKRWEL